MPKRNRTIFTPAVPAWKIKDRKALIEAYGEKAIAPFIKKTNYVVVKLVENEER